jgi:pyruvate dehydrogenase E1 component beta subunit
MRFDEAVEDALALAMERDDRIIFYGEDVRMIHYGLYVRFGARRVRDAPISEAAFVGAAVTAAMAGLRPIVEVMMVDFLGVAVDGLLNQASKVEAFSGGKWKVPMVVRTPCGGGYGDGGQHGQSLWGWLAHIPGLTVVVPSNPADAGGFMVAALAHESPVVYMEPKLLAANWLDFFGACGRKTVKFDVPKTGSQGLVPDVWQPLPFGRAAVVREGSDLTMASVGVCVHRALEAAAKLAERGISVEVLDLRTISPLDHELLLSSVSRTKRMLVVDEDYESCGLSGELAALALEGGLSFTFARVCTRGVIPFAREEEARVLPNTQRIIEAAVRLLQK